MKKILKSIIILGLLLPTSISSVDAAFNQNQDQYGNYEAELIPELTEYWALFISPWEDVGTEDAEYLKDTLISFRWKEENIVTLFYEEASLINVINALDWIGENDDPQDTVLIFINSHGGEGFFCLPGGNMYYSDLNTKLNELDSNSIGIIIGACYSGSAIPQLQHEGRVIITSCQANVTCGYFSHGYITGLADFADYKDDIGNENGVVSLEEAFNYIMVEYNWPTYQPQIQDNYEGELHITFQNWTNGRMDQHPEYTMKPNAGFGIGTGRQICQSFKSNKNVVKKVKISLELRIDEIYPVAVSIRKELDGPDLTSIIVTPNMIEKYYDQYITFDFPDIAVNLDETYYIICKTTEDCPTDFAYIVHGMTEDYYANGECKVTFNNGENWKNWNSPVDISFATFGKDSSENFEPYVPKRVSGSTILEKNIDYTYRTRTEDAEGNNIYYKFDWGDGTSSDWIGPYASGEIIEASKSWTNDGDYYIKVKARDDFNAESNWSSVLKIKVNNPPNPPSISGPSNGNAGVEYYYILVSNDPDDDDISYYIDWGDGTYQDWVGPYPSDIELTFAHTWSETGTYYIKAKTKDIHGAESDWGTLTVTMPYDDNQNSQSTQQSQSQSQSQSSQQQSSQSQPNNTQPDGESSQESTTQQGVLPTNR